MAHTAAYRVKKGLGSFGFYLLLAPVLVLVPLVFVFYYMVTTSLKSPADLVAQAFVWVFQPTLDNYEQVFEQTDSLQFALNSMLLGLGSVLVALVLGLPADYAFVAFDLPGSANRP